MTRFRVVQILLALVVAACTARCGGASGRFTGESNLDGGSIERAIARFETARTRAPDDFTARLQLASLYYLKARAAFAAGDEESYRGELERAQGEILAATRLDPTSAQTHALMGVTRIYQGDLAGAETCFQNALKLNLRLPETLRQSEGVHYTNLAHLAVYQGKILDARRYIERARKLGAPDIELDRIEILAAWRAGDLTEARDSFTGAIDSVPGFTDTWDDAPLPVQMHTFYDFAEVCCSNPTCGPHMGDACARVHRNVQYRQVRVETEEAEQRLEQTRRLEIEAIYGSRKDLEITVEDPNAPVPAPSAPTSGATP